MAGCTQLSKKEGARLDRELKHLKQNLSGVENMTTLPDAMFVIDPNAEVIAVREARRMGVPVVSIVDTNCDPDLVDWVIPGNDDALRAIRLFTSKISDAVLSGRQSLTSNRRLRTKKLRAASRTEDGVDYVDTSAYEVVRKAGRRLRRRRAGRSGSGGRNSCSGRERERGRFSSALIFSARKQASSFESGLTTDGVGQARIHIKRN